MSEREDTPKDVQTEAILKQKEKRYRKVVRRKVVIEEEQDDAPDPKQYEPVKFIFFNEEQRGVPVPYSWVDKWLKIGQCKGMMYDGQVYTLPRVVFEYYRDQCFEPIRSNVEEEVVPGQRNFINPHIS